MEDLFTTELKVNGETRKFRIVFDQEKYQFIPEGAGNPVPAFSFKRDHDEWKEDSELPPEIRNEALEALEKYLLQQH